MKWILALLICSTTPAFAHDLWADGSVVPPWVKSSCCGPLDVHHLDKGQVRALADGWHIEGLNKVLAYGTEMPSQDGDYWIFYRYADGPVYCFFAPVQSF